MLTPLFLLSLAAPQDLARDGWKAVQEAIDRGEAARPELEKTAASADKDAAFYAQAALAEIRTLAAEKLNPLPRSRAVEGPAREVGAALFKAAGLAVEGLPETRVALPAGLPFWEAVGELARQLDGDFTSPGEKHETWRFATPRSPCPTFASGRARARIDRVNSWTFHGLGVPADRSANFSGFLEGLLDFREPLFGGSARILEAVDDRGRTLQGQASLEQEENAKCRWGRFGGSFTLPDGASSRLSRLRMACDFLFREAEEQIEITGFAGATDLKKTFGEVEVTVTRAEPKDKQFVLALNLKGSNVSRRFRPDDLVLSDSQGRRWEPGSGGSGGGGEAYHLEYEYRPPAEDAVPSRITFKLLTRTRVQSVFLEFRDVPLR